MVLKFIENVFGSTRQLSYNKTILCEIFSKVKFLLTYLSQNLAKLDVHAFFTSNAFFKISFILVDKERKLNLHKTPRRSFGRLLSVLCTFILYFISRGLTIINCTSYLNLIAFTGQYLFNFTYFTVLTFKNLTNLWYIFWSVMKTHWFALYP